MFAAVRNVSLSLCLFILPNVIFANEVQEVAASTLQLAHSGTHYYPHQPYHPTGRSGRYICYSHKYFVNQGGGYGWWKYENCHKSWRPCASIGMRHFGRYPNHGAQHRAFNRCHSSQPNYVD